MADEANVQAIRGDDVTLEVTVTNPNGTAFDLTGHTIKFVLKAGRSDADSTALVTKTITETLTGDGQILAPATAGIAHIFIDDTDSLGRTPPPTNLGLEEEATYYHFGIKKKTSPGKLGTLIIGTWRWTREIIGSF